MLWRPRWPCTENRAGRLTMTFDAMARRLIGTLTFESFESDVRERKWAHFAGAFLGTPLYDVARLEQALQRGVITSTHVDVYTGDALMRLSETSARTGKSDFAVAIEQLQRGATLRVRELQMFEPEIAAFARAAQRQLAARVQVNLYLTPPVKKGFPPHFDLTDVFVVQCHGAKQWMLYPHYTGQIDLPPPDTPWTPECFVPEGAAEALVLAAGDVLYLPRGAMHAAACLDEASLHLTVSVAPLTMAEVLARVVRDAAAGDVALRRRAPLRDEPSLKELARDALRRAADEIDLAPFLEETRRMLDDVAQDEPAGSLAAALQRRD